MAVTPEEAVRNYVQYRNDPDAVVDDDQVAQLRKRLEESGDPIERLQLHTEIAHAMDPSRFEEAFVAHAKEWAAEHGVTAKAFEAEGVPRDVLRRAGLVQGRGGGTRRRTSRRPAVTAEEIRAAVPGRGKKFTTKAIQEASGGSLASVRKVLTDMIAAGEVESLGTDPSHTGPGRAPVLYKKVSRS